MRHFGLWVWAMAMAHPVMAQSPIVFAPGTGGSSGAGPVAPQGARPAYTSAYSSASYNRLACTDFADRAIALRAVYTRDNGLPPSATLAASPQRLPAKLLDEALASWQRHQCMSGFGGYGRDGPAVVVVVDYAKPSREPRLYMVDLKSGTGLDNPMLVAHGVGSDRDDDGMADTFSNMPDSRASSLGAARGAEIYNGQNGRSLRLDGLDPSNSAMRYRDIVVHSYAPERRRYFSASLVAARGGKPGVSEGCFVVEPDKREWVLATLANGGFLYAGYSGTLPQPAQRPFSQTAQGPIIFARGTGTEAGPIPQSSLVPPPSPVLGTPAGTSGTLPTTPISSTPTAPPR